jgi:RNA polymerase sigma-B factor
MTATTSTKTSRTGTRAATSRTRIAATGSRTPTAGTSHGPARAPRPDRRRYSDPDAGELFARLARAEDGPHRQALVDEIVALHLPIARALAGRYCGRGIPSDDVMQVAALGLVKAVLGFECDRGATFMAYARPTITGEIKRHFRSTGWAVRPTRRLLELRPRIAEATEQLSQELGRSPTMKELAGRLDATEDDVLEAMGSGGCYSAVSLDAPPDGEHGTWADVLPDVDDTLAATPDRFALQAALAALPRRDRTILAMRFFGDMTQSQIGAELGVSQMQVSRLISRALVRLRERMTDEQPPPAGR